MAVITGQETVHDGGYVEYEWSGLTDSDTGVAITSFALLKDKTVAIQGNFADESVSIEGSMDGTNFFVLNDENGNALSGITAGQISKIAEHPRFIRPAVTDTGTGTPSVDVILGAPKRI